MIPTLCVVPGTRYLVRGDIGYNQVQYQGTSTPPGTGTHPAVVKSSNCLDVIKCDITNAVVIAALFDSDRAWIPYHVPSTVGMILVLGTSTGMVNHRQRPECLITVHIAEVKSSSWGDGPYPYLYPSFKDAGVSNRKGRARQTIIPEYINAQRRNKIDSDSDSPASDSIQSFQLLRSVAAAVVVVNVLVLSRCFPASESHALISHFLPSADTTSTRLRVHSRSWLPPFIAQACNCAGRHDTKTRHGPRSIQIHAL